MICPLAPTCTRHCAHGKPHTRNSFCGSGTCHMGQTACIEEAQMQTYESIIALDEQMYDATCKITKVNRRLGGEVVSIEVEAITINDMPAKLFSAETIAESESQMRTDWRVLGDIRCRSLPEDEDEDEEHEGRKAI